MIKICHAKAKLYIDFPDFRFFRLQPQSASLNGGFGRAYLIEGQDLTILSPANEALAAQAGAIVQDLVDNHPEVLRALETSFKGSKGAAIRVCGLDCGGFEAISGDSLVRYEFGEPVTNPGEIIQHISKIAYSIPEI